MSTAFSHAASNRYDIVYDFAEDYLVDWEPIPELSQPQSQQRPASPGTETANAIYDMMASIYISETHDEFAAAYAALANYILDNTATSVPFLIATAPIRNALRIFSAWMDTNYPAAITITTQLLAQLDVIKAEHGE